MLFFLWKVFFLTYKRETKPMVAQISIEYQHLVQYEPKYGVLICCPWQMTVGKKGLRRHLRECHAISAKERKSLVAALNLSIIESEESFPQLNDVLEPMRGLEIHNAYKCNGCDFVTKSDQLIRCHICNTHLKEVQLSSSISINPSWQQVKVQQCVATGKVAKYSRIQ